MNTFAMIGGLAGGVGLFLLGMGLMTDGLKLAAGPALERILANSTKTRVRGLASGILVTALVQSSSAVTVAAIGFVNAGLLNLSQALWVLFGSNVGTTMTGWLVALVGLKFKIEALALPLIGIGMVLRLTGENKRRGALGMALAGFGVLFLGIDMLKETFSGLSDDVKLPEGDGIVDVMTLVLIGSSLTVLMQSSSAALAIALTAAQGGLLTPQGAAAVVIGANIGTTVTALIAAIGATPNAKRAAAAHILFNLLTGGVALLLLPWLIGMLGTLREWLDLDSSPAEKLALFHTVFNILGVILIWPVAASMTRFLEARFMSSEEDEVRPQHIDKTVLAVPTLALDALEREVRHLGGITLRAMKHVLTVRAVTLDELARDRQVVASLNRAIAEFIVQLNRAGMSDENAHRLPELLRVTRYYEAALELSVEAAEAMRETTDTASVGLPIIDDFRGKATQSLDVIDPQSGFADASAREAALRNTEDAYHLMKAALLAAGTQGRLPVEPMDACLRAGSALRRAFEQASKAVHYLARNSESQIGRSDSSSHQVSTGRMA